MTRAIGGCGGMDGKTGEETKNQSGSPWPNANPYSAHEKASVTHA
jgi:hypothetical protein